MFYHIVASFVLTEHDGTMYISMEEIALALNHAQFQEQFITLLNPLLA